MKGKYKFSKDHSQDPEIRNIQRELEDNFPSYNKDGDLEIEGDLITPKSSVYLGRKIPANRLKNIGTELYFNDTKIIDNTTGIAPHASRHSSGEVDEVSHDDLADTHNLTTDIDHDALTNFVANEHLPGIDEDDMSSNSAAHVPTQQSVKTYVDKDYAEISVVGNAVETAIAVGGTAVQVLIFGTNGSASGATPDHTNDHITIAKTGVYLIMVSATVNSVAGAASRFEMTVQKNNGNVDVGALHCDRNLGGGGVEAGVISMSGLASLTAADTIEVWIENETNTQNYVVEDITLVVLEIG